MGQRVEDDVVINAPRDVVARVIADVDAYPTWADGVRETEVLSTYDDGSPRRARFLVDARVAELSYTIEYEYEGADTIWHLVDGEILSQLDGRYTLTETADGRTNVRYQLEVDVSMPLPGYLKKRAARGILEQGLNGLKRQVEEEP